jgi:hypothetical protein
LGRVPKENEVTQTIDEKNKAFVLEAFETLFNKRDYAAAERFWSPNYIQHSAHIPPGREGLFGLVKGIPDSLHYENGLAVANGNYVLLHGRFTGIGVNRLANFGRRSPGSGGQYCRPNDNLFRSAPFRVALRRTKDGPSAGQS